MVVMFMRTVEITKPVSLVFVLTTMVSVEITLAIMAKRRLLVRGTAVTHPASNFAGR